MAGIQCAGIDAIESESDSYLPENPSKLVKIEEEEPEV